MRSVGEVVAIHINSKPSVYARIEAIQADVKPRWLQVKLLLLSFPPQEVNWIIKAEYLDGGTFTMNDIPVQIFPVKRQGPANKKPSRSGRQGGEVISINKARADRDKQN